MKKLVGLVVFLTFLGCGKGPTVPTPLPTPEPTPTPSPPPLRALPVLFIDLLYGFNGCCDAGGTPEDEGIVYWGWPRLFRERMVELAGYGFNLLHFRTGPDPLESPSLSTLPGDLEAARQLGFLVQIDVLDGWVNRHDRREFPRTCGQDVLLPEERAHVRAVIEASARFENVHYQTSNEAFICNTPKFELALGREIQDVLDDLGYSRPICTNHTDPAVQADPLFACVTVHSSDAERSRAGKPTIINERGREEVSPQGVCQRIAEAPAVGSTYMYWPGDHTREDWEIVFECVTEMSGVGR